MDIDWGWTAKLFWVIYIIGWAVIRFRPNKNSRKTSISITDRNPVERFSMAVSFTGLGIIPAIWVFGGFPEALDVEPKPAFVILGGIVLLFTLYMFRKTHKALGKMWSHSLDLREGHKLVTTGIYEKLRHPMYTAFWLWGVGAFILLPNWLAAISGLIGFGTLYFLRVGQEEEMMESEFGDEYRAYKAKTKKIIPGIY